jgi:ADP-ribose pyrophosphatase
MAKSKLPACLKDTLPLYEGRRIDLYTVNGREAVIHPGAVILLPLLSDSEVILIRNERFLVDECLWELPAGTLEAGETPLQTAARELIEETGYRAGMIEPLCEFYTTPGFCNERMHAFTARELVSVGQNVDESEKITPEILTWDAILSMIQDGAIHDGKTIAVLLYYYALRLNCKPAR